MNIREFKQLLESAISEDKKSTLMLLVGDELFPIHRIEFGFDFDSRKLFLQTGLKLLAEDKIKEIEDSNGNLIKSLCSYGGAEELIRKSSLMKEYLKSDEHKKYMMLEAQDRVKSNGIRLTEVYKALEVGRFYRDCGSYDVVVEVMNFVSIGSRSVVGVNIIDQSTSDQLVVLPEFRIKSLSKKEFEYFETIRRINYTLSGLKFLVDRDKRR